MGAAQLEQVEPGIRRLLAPNPGPFTFTGTQVYVVGEREVAVIDPGPDDPVHVATLIAALAGSHVNAILCTHTHRDHSPAGRPLAQATGAPIIGCAPLTMPNGAVPADDSFDDDYTPDAVLSDGGRVVGDGWTMEVVATPGHTSNHLCFAMPERKVLFSGDHVMGWSTSIVIPPDGDMGDYMASLETLRRRDDRIYYPTHGPAVTDPHARVEALIAHRHAREAAILAQVGAGQQTVAAMVAAIYTDVDPALHPAAALSVLAHLLDLQRRGLVARDGAAWRPASHHPI